MIEFTVEQIEKAERLLGHIPGAASRALSNAINRAAESAKTEASRKVREEYFVSHKDVVSTMKIFRASAFDTSASIVSRGSVFALTKFRVTPKKPQPKRSAAVRWKKGRSIKIVSRVKRGQGGKIESAFVTKMRSGHVGVFRRTGKKRFPIEQFYGPSVPQMLINPRVTEAVETRAREVLDARLDHEIKRILEGQE